MKSASVFPKRRTVAILLICVFIFGFALGYLASFYYVKVPVPVPKAKDIVGVIRVEGPIISSQEASRYIDAINNAIVNETIKAVALIVDSPGGYADLIEAIYLDLLELKEEKPLATSAIFAASGGYYIAVASDYIYVSPTSIVGNIGLIAFAPPTLIPSEQVLETGAYKATGWSKILFPHNVSHALDNFVSAVEKGRGDRLKLSPTQLKRGMVYLGSEAVAVGLADEIGSLQKAIGRVAKEAGLVEYDVVELVRDSSSQTANRWENLSIEVLSRLHPPPALYYLYLPPAAFAQGLPPAEFQVRTLNISMSIGSGKKGMVLVDLSHGNKVSWWELDILIAELVKRDMGIMFVPSWCKLELALDDASALIVASPTLPYSSEEGEKIEEFVNKGKMLLLFFDPAAEYVEIPDLFGPINSLSTRFGLSFAKGYLYNEEDHFGFYRNIYARDFVYSSLTRDLNSIVLFTATHIRSPKEAAVAWASQGTYSSVAEKIDKYVVIALVRDKGTVAAFGDLTFLKEPYCYLEDNYKLIENIASAILLSSTFSSP